ncbi:3'-5' exonuclease [Ancylomarina sp. 16SWW S1-10-2]|uniref:3'-5' exonuclease n=1 Tax=Ancylomarina sp. 16SWW S1-10-2 TaxID=2499681 RepID=UPI0012AD3035|nr:3'-5' exonuclease [Ancylomarina sp. 16SWW S1-10-2]MRT93163.1 3'-5' exonuclease domain-containing protein 2 [Ancylomarina sp. 16SWW S1-10-2]
MISFQKSITKDEINELSLEAFEGEIVVIDSDEGLQEAVDYLKQFPVLGFDTETKPSFTKGSVNPVALLQLSSSEKSFLFRLNRIGLPAPVIELLSNSEIIKVGAAIKDDVRGLQEITDFDGNSFLELQQYVTSFGIENFSLKKLAAIVLNIRISKRQQVSNWEASELSAGQLRYAATDAWVSLEIYEGLKASICKEVL